MTGHKFNNKNKKGQVLLIAVMLLATIITVVMTIAFNATTQTQTTKLEEDSQKALAAAEAGIDTVIKQSVGFSVPIANIGQFSSQGITGNARVVATAYPYFVTPLLQKDEQYTFYLSNYPGYGSPWNGSFNLYFASETNQCPSVMVTVITSTYAQQRYIYSTCANTVVNVDPNSSIQSTATVDTTVFQWKTRDPITITNGLVAFVTILNSRTKLGFKNTTSGALPLQGKTITSEARTKSGVVKKVQLFQSYPQMPSNFFMTGF